MKHTIAAAVLGLALLTPTTAMAAPGLGGEIYGATVSPGEFELESRYDALAGGPDDGEDMVKLELGYGVSKRLRVGLQGEFEREPGSPRKAEELGIEAIYTLGRVGGIDVALYGEYAIGLDGPDKIETKLLLQHRPGPFDLRLNLIAEKELTGGAKVDLAYAAQADVAVAGDLRVGVQAFGDLGTFDRVFPAAGHMIGPVVSTEVEGLGPELKLEAGYLFALGTARQDTRGQFRLALELEF